MTELTERDRELRQLVMALAEDPIAATPWYVLRHGRAFIPAPLPADVEPGEPQHPIDFGVLDPLRWRHGGWHYPAARTRPG